MRLLLALALASWGWAIAPGWRAQAGPGDCPPFCDSIPDSAWLSPTALPLYDVYRWPHLPGLAVTASSPRFKFEEMCSTPPIPGDDRAYAVAARAVVPQSEGQWQLQVQVLHWRGETWRGGQIATGVVHAATTAMRACHVTAPLTSPSITTDVPGRLAAVISVSGQRVLHQYLLADARNSSVVEVAMWATSPPRVDWRSFPDAALLDAMAAPLCTAYIDSCR
jgi:hypothetical protein